MLKTPHINSEEDAFGKTVLMPGDPLRAKYIAETFFENPVLVNNVRGVQGYTGTYKGVKVSVMASGMGIPSIGIYSWELFNVFHVENIIRVGTIGALDANIKVRDIIIGMGACTTSRYIENFKCPGTFAPIANYELMKTAIDEAEKLDKTYYVGNVLSSDVFYNDDPNANENWIKMGVLGIEMEAAGLYSNAIRARKRALAICTVSDNIITGEEIDAMARQTSVDDMIVLALNTAVAMENK